jgi:hypothetical protein
MMNSVLIKNYPAPELDRGEILRYAMCKDTDDISSMIDECVNECVPRLCYKVCYRRFELKRDGEWLDLGFVKTKSEALRRNLLGCDEVVVFAATVGLYMDRLIARYTHTSAAKSLIMCAVGSERVESLCDAFERDIAKEAKSVGKNTRPRFSPGYGDLPLELQSDIFRALAPEGKIGISLNQSLLMSPSKSVTAIIGIG